MKGYKVRGARVFLGHPDMEISGKIEQQRFGGPGSQFLVHLDDPISPEDYETALDLLPSVVRKVFEEAKRSGAVDAGGNMRAIWARFQDVALDVRAAKRGTLAEFQDADPKVYDTRVTPGKIVGLEEGIGRAGEDLALFELIEPLPLWQVPRGVAWQYMKGGFASKSAYFVDESVSPIFGHPEFERVVGSVKEVTANAKRMFALETPTDLSKLVELVRRMLPGWTPERAQFWMIYFVLPFLVPDPSAGALFRPMREDLARGLELEVWEGAEWLEGLT